MSDQALLDRLHSQADKLGLSYHHRAGADKLKAMIGSHLADNPTDAYLLIPGSAPLIVETVKMEVDLNAKPPLSEKEYGELLRKTSKTRVARLRRIRFTNMNPTKKNWPGEIISVGSAKLGTFKKHIPFNGEPYHVPQIIYDVMKERQCSIFYSVERKRGGDIRKSKLINEYAIEDLAPLTSQELELLASRQQLADTGL